MVIYKKTPQYEDGFVAILIVLSVACKKDNEVKLGFEFLTREVCYYPEKHIAMTFDIIPTTDKETYTFNWFNPDSLKGKGPFRITISSNLILDFEIIETKNRVQRFQYEIKTDSIDSLKYDYRNNYIGTYSCRVIHFYEDSTSYYQDTLAIVKNNSFNMLNILIHNDIINNYEGNKMTYLNANGSNSYQTGDFYG